MLIWGQETGESNTGSLSEPRFVGRVHELGKLLLSLNSVIAGRGTTILVSGEAGSGKTRLALEFLEKARDRGVAVLHGWCLSNAGVPYFPFAEAFGTVLSDDVAKTFGSQQLKMKAWLMEPSLNGRLEGSGAFSPQTWRDQAFAAVVRELLIVSSARPVVLFIDDIHWADSASLSLFHYIARAINSERILLLATFRTEEIAPGSEGQPRPLAEALRLMGREGVFIEIKLPRLTHGDIHQIADSMLGGNAHLGLVEKLALDSGGNPLYVVESLRMLYEKENLVQESGQWRLTSDELGIPAKVKDIIMRRLESLSPSKRRILDVASVIGEKFDPKIVAAVFSQDRIDVLESLNAISQSTLLVYDEGDCYRFDHAKSREMLYERLPMPLRREYHIRIGEAIESSTHGTNEIPLSDLAYHYSQGGNKEKSVNYALAAGNDALKRFSNKEAINHFNYVLQIIPEDTSKHNDLRVAALEGLGEASFANSTFRKAIQTFEQMAKESADTAKLKALRRAMDSAFFQGEFAHLLELTKEAEGHSSSDRLESARVLMNRARAVMFLGDYLSGRNDFEAALKVFEEECSLPDVARCLLALGGIQSKGELEKGLPNALRAVTYYEELGDSRGLMDACNRAGQSFTYRMLTEEALRMHARAAEIGKKIGDFNRIAEGLATSVLPLEAAGDFSEALSKSLNALEYCEKTESTWVRGIVYSNLARQYAKIGDLEHAEEYYEKLLKLPKEVLLTGFVNFALSKAVMMAVKENWSEANRGFEECLESHEGRVTPSVEIATRTYYSWALNLQGKSKEATEQFEAARKTITELELRFQRVILHLNLMVPKRVELDREFTVRIDIINASRKPTSLLCVEKLVPNAFRVNEMTEFCTLKGNSVMINETKLDPFQVKSIEIDLLASQTGVFIFEPRVAYVDDSGKAKALEPKPVTITVERALTKTESATDVEARLQSPPTFKSEAAQQTFDYLLDVFWEDYQKLKLAKDKAGWRTLLTIVKMAKVSKYSLYGSSGHKGHALSELERLGLIETRVFSGERGRGGEILKLRVASEAPIVQRLIELRSKPNLLDHTF